MKGYILTCATALLVAPAWAGEAHHTVTLLHGHPMYDEVTQKAGVSMGLSIAGSESSASQLTKACRELQRLSELRSETGDGLELVTLFIIPYKNMAVEGFYMPSDGSFGSNALLKGKPLDGSAIEGLVALAGIPRFVLHETNVEQEISCDLEDSVWTIVWQDIRAIDDEEPEVTIEQARARFMSIYRNVVQYASQTHNLVAGSDRTMQAMD